MLCIKDSKYIIWISVLLLSVHLVYTQMCGNSRPGISHFLGTFCFLWDVVQVILKVGCGESVSCILSFLLLCFDSYVYWPPIMWQALYRNGQEQEIVGCRAFRCRNLTNKQEADCSLLDEFYRKQSRCCDEVLLCRGSDVWCTAVRGMLFYKAMCCDRAVSIENQAWCKAGVTVFPAITEKARTKVLILERAWLSFSKSLNKGEVCQRNWKR